MQEYARAVLKAQEKKQPHPDAQTLAAWDVLPGEEPSPAPER
jgi:hypothetical protein